MSTEIEVVETLDVAAATRLDKRIRLMASTVRENLTKIATLVEEAKAGEIHVALGFASWTAYLADALGGQIELGTDSRRSVVELLAGEGMSNRAIATAVGVTEGTVRNDKVRSDYAPEPVTGLDGKTYKKSGTKKKPDSQPATVAIGHEEAMRAAARIAELSAWGKACDGLLAALSFAAASRPPEDTDQYPSFETFAERYSALGSRISEWFEHRPSGDEILAQSDELDSRAVAIVKDLFTTDTAPAEPIEEEPDGDTHTLWSPDVTITVTKRIDYEDLRPWTLAIYRRAIEVSEQHRAEIASRKHDKSKPTPPWELIGYWIDDPADTPDLDVFGATYLRLNPLILIGEMATWIAQEFNADSITVADKLLTAYKLWDWQITESIKKRNAAGGDLGE